MFRFSLQKLYSPTFPNFLGFPDFRQPWFYKSLPIENCCNWVHVEVDISYWVTYSSSRSNGNPTVTWPNNCKKISYLLIASAFSDSSMASGRLKHPPEISKTAKGMAMKFLPDVGTHMEAQNQEKLIYLSRSVNYRKIPKIPIFWKCIF